MRNSIYAYIKHHAKGVYIIVLCIFCVCMNITLSPVTHMLFDGQSFIWQGYDTIFLILTILSILTLFVLIRVIAPDVLYTRKKKESNEKS